MRDGTRRRGDTPQPSVVGGRSRPDRPPGLDADQRKLWDIVLDDLEEGNVLDAADWSVVEVFVVELSRLRQARRVIAKEGMFAEGQKGAPIIHPARQLEERAGKNVASLADALGLGPSGRARLGLAKKQNGERHGRSMNSGGRVPESARALRAVQGGRS